MTFYNPSNVFDYIHRVMHLLVIVNNGSHYGGKYAFYYDFEVVLYNNHSYMNATTYFTYDNNCINQKACIIYFFTFKKLFRPK